MLGINKNVIEIYDKKYIKSLDQDFHNIFLKAFCYIKSDKRHNLIFKMAILGFKNRFLLIIFFYLFLIIYICEIKLSKLLGLS